MQFETKSLLTLLLGPTIVTKPRQNPPSFEEEDLLGGEQQFEF